LFKIIIDTLKIFFYIADIIHRRSAMTILGSDSTSTPEVKENTVQQAEDQSSTESSQVQKKSENPEQSQPSETHEDPNWRAFREARKRDRAEKEAAERKAAEKEAEVAALKTAMEAAFSNGTPSPQAQQQYYGMNSEPDETEEQRIERKVDQLLAKKEEQYRKQQAEYESKSYPQRLLKDMPDFNHVCSTENLDYLDYHYPEISRPLQRLGDGYDKWYDTYHAVKKLIPNHSNAKKDAMRADMNSNKPRSMSSTGPSPTSGKVLEPMQETEARRAENWARMQRVMKGVG